MSPRYLIGLTVEPLESMLKQSLTSTEVVVYKLCQLRREVHYNIAIVMSKNDLITTEKGRKKIANLVDKKQL